jgi:hypothetical protein
MSTTHKTNIKHEAIHQTGQDLQGERVVETDGRVLRARVRRNAYDKQSWAMAEVLTGNGWADLVNLPIGDCSVSGFSYVSRAGDWEGAMASDLGLLIEIALDIVEGWAR